MSNIIIFSTSINFLSRFILLQLDKDKETNTRHTMAEIIDLDKLILASIGWGKDFINKNTCIVATFFGC